ncbi:hypothetical protein CCP3SC1_1680002 [Gammaproteobacteria bacterium]
MSATPFIFPQSQDELIRVTFSTLFGHEPSFDDFLDATFSITKALCDLIAAQENAGPESIAEVAALAKRMTQASCEAVNLMQMEYNKRMLPQ